ncbi:hypothetical protein D043_2032B, partial [Vibrio parahaemolyticus EKP-021]
IGPPPLYCFPLS